MKYSQCLEANCSGHTTEWGVLLIPIFGKAATKTWLLSAVIFFSQFEGQNIIDYSRISFRVLFYQLPVYSIIPLQHLHFCKLNNQTGWYFITHMELLPILFSRPSFHTKTFKCCLLYVSLPFQSVWKTFYVIWKLYMVFWFGNMTIFISLVIHWLSYFFEIVTHRIC